MILPVTHSRWLSGTTCGFRRIVAAALVTACTLATNPAACAAAQPQPVAAADGGVAKDYARAERLLPWNLQGKVTNLSVEPHWLADADRFWYRRDSKNGHEFVIVDAASATRAPAFDHVGLAEGLSRLTGREIGPEGLPFDDFAYEAGSGRIVLSLGDGQVRCDGNARSCEKITADSGARAPGTGALPSPDGRLVAFTRDDNLWIREAATGRERPLTTDGVKHYGFGSVPEMAIGSIPRRRLGVELPPYSTVWSPDSRKVVVARVDERAVGEMYVLESAPANGSVHPVQHTKKVPSPGDAAQTHADYMVVDVESGGRIPIRLHDEHSQNVFLTPETTAWSPDNRLLYTIARSAYGLAGYLLCIDTATGAVRRVIEEQTGTGFRFNSVVDGAGPNVRVLPASNEALWFSERDGWGHLYLYDLASGKLKNRITQGAWLVRDIIQVDAGRRTIYFTGGGREEGRNPYYRHLYRVSFDGSGLTLLTPEDADHEFTGWQGANFGLFPAPAPPPSAYFSKDSRYFIDTYSTVSTPPVSVLRRAKDGRVVARLETADPSALVAAGWKPPQPFTVKGADGRTDLHGLIYRPTQFDEKASYPVLDHIYQGPNLAAVPWNFAGFQGYFNAEMQARAELGFIIIQVDGRGTPNRSREFREAMYGKLDEFRIDDHVATIRELGRRVPQMDLDRVGIYGHSFGGYGSARAMLLYPDFFKVCVSSAGIHHFGVGAGNWVTQFQGPPVIGTRDDTSGDAALLPENYRSADNRALAARLKGKLMLAYGDLDENTGTASLLQLAGALIDANKSFDLLYLPNRSHHFGQDPYFIRRSWDYFVEHLRGLKPPVDYAFQQPPGNRH